jgi:hypothetical protein
MAYSYEPLPALTSYTRLITLHPSRRTRQDLHCSLSIINLHEPDRPTYEAISYTWDGQVPSPAHILWVRCDNDAASTSNLSTSSSSTLSSSSGSGSGGASNGECHRPLYLTANSARALQSMRLRDRPRRLWMDAVCINQNDPVDKNHQVANMKRVYSLADRVLVYLPRTGPESFGVTPSRTELTMSFLREIARLDSQSSSARRELGRIFRRMRTELGTTDEMIQMYHLFGHPWFHRVWTLQEVALNTSSDAQVHCGATAISWHDVQQARSLHYLLDPDAADRRWQPVSAAMNAFELLRAEVRVMTKRNPRTGRVLSGPFTSQTYSLLEILRMARTRRAADPRDSVFGVFGICQALGIECPLPDYGMDVRDVFLEATKKIMEAERNPSVLMDVVAPGRDLSLPSWVPDWHSGWDPQCVTGRSHTKSGFIRSRDFRFSIDRSRRALTLKGQVVRPVTWVGAKVPDCDWGVIFPDATGGFAPSPKTKCLKLPVEVYRYPAAYSAMRQCLQMFPNGPIIFNGGAASSYGGLMTALLVNNNGGGVTLQERQRHQEVSNIQSDKKARLWTHFCRALLANDEVPLPGSKGVKNCPPPAIEELWKSVGDGMRQEYDVGVENVEMARLYTDTLRSLSGRTFCAIDAGVMAVLGDVEAGDVVAVLRGLNDLAVLRKTEREGEYTFVGIASRGLITPMSTLVEEDVQLTLV